MPAPALGFDADAEKREDAICRQTLGPKGLQTRAEADEPATPTPNPVG